MLSQKTIDIVKSTVPVLEEHGTKITKRFYQMMFENHPELLNIFNHANQRKGRQQTALANTVYVAAVYIDRLEEIIPVVKQIAHKHRSLGVKPEHYPIVGENLLAAIKDVFGDAATDEIINAWAEAYGVIADAFIGVEKEMYDAAGWDDFIPFSVVQKVKESDEITSFYLKPVDNRALPSFIPGQYISLKLDQIPGEEYTHIRQYSLSDVPGRDYYRISVKREKDGFHPDGVVTNFLHDQINEGDQLLASAPAGDFTIEIDSNDPIVLLAGGVGTTPLMSMMNHVLETQPEREIVMVQAVRNGQVHAFREDILAKNLNHPTLQYYACYSAPTDEDKQEGRFHKEGFVTKEWLDEIVPNVAKSQFYFCGPVSFMKHIYATLKEMGVSENQIHFEFFGPSMSIQQPEEVLAN
ncbi:nitric oxide dioxygenase [Bacillus oleivorans]|uniref:Flavohemoprotein n=1 Tax=Bacillus oleivorans TaxID=1448271 RepID=A0A285CJ49_9BACI|nr:NO-inducible flavohemoprotein [Bacillus oleivorans]SNX67038.1 nitric oxide dioxygenase [Bacillus oleivorans]